MSWASGCTRRVLLKAGAGLSLSAQLLDAAAQAGTLTLTLLEGPAALVLGARAFEAREGLRLSSSTLIETGTNAGLLRLEAPDGSLMDLGPDSRAMLQGGPRSAQTPRLYLLSGWAKLQSGPSKPHAGLLSPLLELEAGAGAVVVQARPDQVFVFCESGSAKLLERSNAKGRHSLAAGGGYRRPVSGTGELLARPDPSWLRTVPRAFRDPIPPQLSRFDGPAPLPGKPSTPRYQDLQAWLRAEPSVRREFPRRFAVLAQDPSFRAELAKNLGAHPEWERVLFPERFLKPASAPASGARP